jgi:hypothetical protein
MSLLDRMLFDQQDEALIMGDDPAQDTAMLNVTG